jgi:hypothetical protein
MKFSTIIFSALLILTTPLCFSQTPTKELRIGHSFNISIPNYMTRTIGLNDVASLQFKNEVKDIYGIVIEDNKEELALAELNYSSINEFAEDFLKTFLDDEKTKKITTPTYIKKGSLNFAEAEATYTDAETNVEIYYMVGIVETKTSYYKVLSWCESSQKDKYKEDFQKIIYSLKD